MIFFDYKILDNPLHITWCNRIRFPPLNQHNVLTYFADKSNPFYDHTCNNEHLKMRNLHPRELEKMKGIEYILLHSKEPILFVIRKQQRHSPTYVVPLANYYIIAGVIYQAPDLKSIVESKLLTTMYSLQSAFEECFNYARFHPSTDYTWTFDRDNSNDMINFKENGQSNDNNNENGKDSSINNNNNSKNTNSKETFIIDGSNQMRLRYRESVDGLLWHLLQKFPLNPQQGGGGEQKQLAIQSSNNTTSQQTNTSNANDSQTSSSTTKQSTTSSNGSTIKMEDEHDNQGFNEQQQRIKAGQKSAPIGSSSSTMMMKKPKLN